MLICKSKDTFYATGPDFVGLSHYGDTFQEREQKTHKELQTNLLAIKYLQTVHKNLNNQAGEEIR